MKTLVIDREQSSHCQPAARDPAERSTSDAIGHSSQHTSWINNLQSSPRMVAQRQALRAAFGDAVQLQPERLEEERSPLQGKRDAVASGDAVRAQAPPATNQTGMPNQLKAAIESLSGMDMSDVRVHANSDKPEQLHSFAYAQGNDIHLAPGQERHLAHEAWHVVQQAQGRVRATRQVRAGLPVNDDRGLEREADLMGGRAMQLTGRRSEVALNHAANSDNGDPSRPVFRARSNPVQRYLIVGAVDLTREYKEESEKHVGADKDVIMSTYLNTRITQIAQAMLPELSQADVLEKKVYDAIVADDGGKLRAQITKWIEDIPGDKAKSRNLVYGRKNQARVYANFKDLALALYGWVKAKPARHEEKQKAQEIQANPAIAYHLDSILLKIGAWIEHRAEKVELHGEIEVPGQVGGHDWNIYQKYFNTAGIPQQTLPANYKEVLTNPHNYNIRQKTGTLHDLMHYFMEKKKAKPGVDLLDDAPAGKATVIDDPLSGSVKREDYARPENSQIRKRDAKKLVDAANLPGGAGPDPDKVKVSAEESHPSYRLARFKNIPMYGRHSYTATRMMLMVQKSGGTKDEISALAWSIMAYWRVNYDHRSIPYHTLHEIMDLTPEIFGIPYNIDNRYAGLDLFTAAGLIQSLQTSILARRENRDLLKLIDVDTKRNVAAWFLANRPLWAIDTVMTFLKTTALPLDEFVTLDRAQLYAFFDHNDETRSILPRIAPEKRRHVEEGRI